MMSRLDCPRYCSPDLAVRRPVSCQEGGPGMGMTSLVGEPPTDLQFL
jgi:hypothetical protein